MALFLTLFCTWLKQKGYPSFLMYTTGYGLHGKITARN